jgi:hypothetical protein
MRGWPGLFRSDWKMTGRPQYLAQILNSANRVVLETNRDLYHTRCCLVNHGTSPTHTLPAILLLFSDDRCPVGYWLCLQVKSSEG